MSDSFKEREDDYSVLVKISVAVLTTFWLAAPLKAEEAHHFNSLPLAIEECQECDRQLADRELKVELSNQHTNLQLSTPVQLSPNLSKHSGMQTAQIPVLPPVIVPPQPPIPSIPPKLQPLPPPEQLLQPATPTPIIPESYPNNLPGAIVIERFEFKDNTAFTNEQLAKLIQRYTGHPITFAQLLEARSAITQLYIEKGFITSGAIIPPQTLDKGVVIIQVIEGRLEEIKVNGLRRLNPKYIRSRIAAATSKALNVNQLLAALRLVQLDPLIASISAELSAGSQPGNNVLIVEVKETKSFSTQIFTNNNRSPSIGSFRRGVQIREANLLGRGDGISVAYSNTDGSNTYDLTYTLPINPRNGTLSFSYGNISSRIIEPPFNKVDIKASSRYYDLTFRQPISQTTTEEFILGLTVSRRESNTSLLGMPFSLSQGSDDRGKTRVQSLRFFQEWTQQGSQNLIAARSQFSVGLGILDATLNPKSPDSNFFSWRGQGQWVRLLGKDTLFLVRGDVQLSDRPLLPFEQYGIGGQETLRGYRQDLLLADNGANFTAEVRLPIARIPEWKSLIQVVPFIDFGTVWNNTGNAASSNTLVGTGLGLQLQIGSSFTARLDYGIPLISVKSNASSLQENGLYFSILFNRL